MEEGYQVMKDQEQYQQVFHQEQRVALIFEQTPQTALPLGAELLFELEVLKFPGSNAALINRE